MKKTTASQRSVLGCLIFPETFDTLLSETGLQRGEIRDDLMQLINSGMVEVVDDIGIKKLTSFDSDNLQEHLFRATRSGLSVIQNQRP